MTHRTKEEKTNNIPAGTVVEDDFGSKWIVGKPIGRGGFGETYSVRKPNHKSFRFALKIGDGNKVFFNELIFYMKKATPGRIDSFVKEKNLDRLGVVELHGYGSMVHEQRHLCFLVMTRYCSDLAKIFKRNTGGCTDKAAFHIASQMLDIFEFFHDLGYAHGDLKASNIVLTAPDPETSTAFLIDFGLVKPLLKPENEGKRGHRYSGTVKYSSRDLHYGFVTRRSDLEILGYNLIEWLGARVPWTKVEDVRTVRNLKKSFMKDIDYNLKTMFPNGTPDALRTFMGYVANMKRYEKPNYDFLKQILVIGAKGSTEVSP